MQASKRQQVLRILTGVFLVFALGACANSSSGGSSGTDQKPPTDQPQPQAEEFGYYQSLLASQEGACTEPDGIRFLALGAGAGIKLGTTEEGHDLVLNLQVHLLKDQTFALDYAEEIHTQSRRGLENIETIFTKRILGSWHLEKETQLHLTFNESEELAIGNRLQVGEQKFVQLKLKKRINDARALSPFIKLQKQVVLFGPSGETPVEACSK